MANPKVTQAAIKLLDKRARLLQAELRRQELREEYTEAESQYLNAWDDTPVIVAVIENIAILPKSDWFDIKPGFPRVDFETVEILTEGQS